MGRLSEVLGALPPPAYETVANHGSEKGKPFSKPRGLDASLVLMILSNLIDPSLSAEQQAIGYSNLHKNVRFASKDLYLLCMHLLRSKYIKRYMNRVRAPYTTDPYPAGQAIPSTSEPVIARSRFANSDGLQSSKIRRGGSGGGTGRETRILDLFVAASVRSDVESFESSLLESTLGDDEEGENDLFAYHQPKCRIEDLVIQKGRNIGIIRPDPSSIAIPVQDTKKDINGPPSYTSPEKNFALGSHNAKGKRWIEAEDLAIELRSKSAILRVRSDQSSSRALRTVFEVTRAREEVLEITAERIVTRLAG